MKIIPIMNYNQQKYKTSFNAKIHECAGIGDIQGYKAEVAKGVDPNTKDEYDWSPLRHAIHNRQHAMVEEIIHDENVDVNETDSFGITNLTRACWLSDRKLAQLLLKRKDIDINKVSRIGGYPIESAIFNAVQNYEHMVKNCCYGDSHESGFKTLYECYEKYLEHGDEESDNIVFDLLNRRDINLLIKDKEGRLLLERAENDCAGAPWLDKLRKKTLYQLKHPKALK